jgi:ClpP class serine protease
MIRAEKDFEESKHPRKDDGKFGEGSGDHRDSGDVEKGDPAEQPYTYDVKGDPIDPQRDYGRWNDRKGGTQTITLHRAADDDYATRGYSFAEEASTAEAYTKNEGFGGKKLFHSTVTLNEDQIFDARGMNAKELADAFDVSDPGAIGPDEWVPRSEDLLDALEAKGILFIRVDESFPEDTTTWIFSGPSDFDPELSEGSGEKHGKNAMRYSGPAPKGYKGLRKPYHRSVIWRPDGMLAVHPQAIGALVPVRELPDAMPLAVRGNVAVIGVRGPLMHHTDYGCASYDGLKSRVAEALATPAQYLLLSIDSPGGLLAGCLDCVTEVRAMVAAAGKRIFSYVDSMSCSAAYGLCLIGERVYVPVTGVVGSIGVIETLVDCTKADAAMGLRFSVVTSGERKADSNPHAPISEGTLAAYQADVDRMAGIFFDTVAQYRPGVNRDSVRALQAGVLVGADAIAVGLADETATEDEVVALLNSGRIDVQTLVEPAPKMANFADAVASLQSVIDDESTTDEDKAKARKMIIAASAASKAEGDEPDGDEGKKDEPKDEPEAKAEHAEPDGDEGKKASRGEQRFLDIARTTMLASRPDFTSQQIATLRRAPLALVEDAVRNWPRNPAPGPVAQAMAAQGTKATVQPETTPTEADPAKGPMSDYERNQLARFGGGDNRTKYESTDGYFCTPSCTVEQQQNLIARKMGLDVAAAGSK